MLEKKSIKLAKHDIAYYKNSLPEVNHPALIFIHGNSSRKEIFNKISDSRYLQKYPIFLIDLPGHGESSWDQDAKYDITYHAETIKEFLKALQIQSPVLIGHSLGGHIAVKLSSLIETKGLVIFQAPPVEYIKDLPRAFHLIPEFNSLYVDSPSEEELQNLINVLSGDSTIQNEIRSSFKSCDPKIRSRLGLSLTNPEEHIGEVTQLKNYEKPLLIIHGENDPLVNLTYIKELSFPIQLIEGGGHYPTLANPSRFFNVLENFLKE